MKDARIPAFYRQTVQQRLRLLQAHGWLSPSDLTQLQQGNQVLTAAAADKMIENVVGVLGMPLAVGLNFLINGQQHVIPLAVEEPSIVAALGASAKLVRQSGGFFTESTPPLLIGQVQVLGVAHPSRAQQAILQSKQQILNLANSLHPKMVARGGGARDIEVRLLSSPKQGGDMLVVHLLVDTCDAMGANLVNTMCEGVAGLIEELTYGRVFLRILSNLTDRAMVKARVVIDVEHLRGKHYTGEQVRDGIILANDFASLDPYRAVTHNKGIMNGIDAVALATGNDWRAIEAAAHAYAGRGQSYTALTKWSQTATGALEGALELPLKVGTVGGNLQSNPAVALAHRVLASTSARHLAEIMGAVGLAQNLAALRALATEGIQQGHMTLHARSVVMSAGVPSALFDEVLDKLVQGGEIKVWKAQDIAASLGHPAVAPSPCGQRSAAPHLATEQDLQSMPCGFGKVVLLGEHAVVYGHHALAAPIALGVRARICDATAAGVHLLIPAWGVEGHLRLDDTQNTMHASLQLILRRVGLEARKMVIEVFPQIPRAMGLGGSAALAVEVLRALSAHFKLALSDPQINALAYEAETLAHGVASGVDNTLSTYGKLMLFGRAQPGGHTFVAAPAPVTLVLGFTGVESLTAKMVAQLGRMRAGNPALYDKIFADIDALTLQGRDALEAGRLDELGELFNVNQGLLNALQMSSWELEEIIAIARRHGALGAKLTGGGGGGCIIALCRQQVDAGRIVQAIRRAGYQASITSFC